MHQIRQTQSNVLYTFIILFIMLNIQIPYSLIGLGLTPTYTDTHR